MSFRMFKNNPRFKRFGGFLSKFFGQDDQQGPPNPMSPNPFGNIMGMPRRNNRFRPFGRRGSIFHRMFNRMKPFRFGSGGPGNNAPVNPGNNPMNQGGGNY